MAKRPLTDPIAGLITDLSEAVTGSRPTWQQNVTETTERLTSGIADSVSERVQPSLTDAIRRTISGSRSASTNVNVTVDSPAWSGTGNVTPGATFQRFTGEIPDLNNPPRFTETAPPRRTVSSSRSGSIPPQGPPDDTIEQRTARHAEEARRIVEEIAATATAAAGGGIPPVPPGNDPPNGPPDPPDDDNNDIWRMLTEYLRRLLGVDFGDLANIMSRLMMNGTTILGGVTSMNVPNGPAGHAANLMDTIADYFNVPRETEEATREAQENLRRSIDRLTEATDGATGANPAQPQGRFARIRAFFSRRRGGRRGGMATATRIASRMRPLLNGITNLLPYRWRMGAARLGQNAIGGIAQRFGVPAATAARFGAAIGPAALGIGIVAKAIPIVGTAVMAIGKFASELIRSLRSMSDAALKTTISLAEYSAGLSHGKAALEYGRTLRKINLAQGNEEFGGFHLRQRNRFENAVAPWEQMATNAGSLAGGVIDSAMATIVEQLNTIVGYAMKVHASILLLVPGDQGEAKMFAAADKLLNPDKPGDNPPWADFQKLLGANNPDQLDMARRMNNKPRQPGGVGK